MDTQIKDTVINKLPVNLREKLLLEMSFVKNMNLLKYLPSTSTLEILLTKKLSQVVIDS